MSSKNIGLLCCCKKIDKNEDVPADHMGGICDASDATGSFGNNETGETADLKTILVASKENEGNPRNKVALSPGHSLMDWIRLGNSGKDLTGVGGKLRSVTEEELSQHHQISNAWLVIRGQVYNVAPYMDFHPGGVEELMKGAGKDATKLFTEVHPWVNYESILQKCLVGRLVKSKPATQEDLSKAFFDVLAPPSAMIPKESKCGMTWHQTTGNITFRVQTGCPRPHVLVRRRDDQLRILLRSGNKVKVFSFRPAAELLWPCTLSVVPKTGQLDAVFRKKVDGCWDKLGVEESDHAKEICDNSEMEAYYSAEIVAVETVTHNCRLFVLKFSDPVCFWLPIGHDIRVTGTIEGVDVARRYTPAVVPCASAPVCPSNQLSLLVKHYPHGALTPHIFNKKIGECVDVGGLGGDFNVRDLEDIDCLYLIAAGTGITPMTRLIAWSLTANSDLSSVQLLFLNRSEKDIIWKKELDELASSHSKFSVCYALSQPGADWTGIISRLNQQHIADFMSAGTDISKAFVCVCGPVEFNEDMRRILDDLGWSTRSYYFGG